MQGKPTVSGPGRADGKPSPADTGSEVERSGPLELRRMTKEDGRALLVFRRAEAR